MGRPARGARGRRRCRCSRRGSSRRPSTCAKRGTRAPTRRCCSCATSTTHAARELMRSADALGLDTLVEAHDADELARAVALDAPVVGINARDLATFAHRPRRAAGARRPRAARPHRDRRERDRDARAGGRRRARRRECGPRRLDADARAPTRARSSRELVQRPLVKVCGLTRQEDVDVAVDAGADLVGFILAAESPRRTDALLDAPDTVLRVAVFVGEQRRDGRRPRPVLRARERPPCARRGAAPGRRARRLASSTCRGARTIRRTSSVPARPRDA